MKKKKFFGYLVVALLSVSLFTACGNKATTESTNSSSTQTTEASSTKEANSSTTITDMAGRSVEIPDEIKSVYSANPISAIYLYTIVPDKLAGWNYELNDIEKSIILEKYQSLPNFGMGDAVNYEAVIAASPTIALSATTINDGTTDDADKLSKKLGIPVVVIDSDLTKAPEAYRFLGELFDTEDDAEKLASYAEQTFKDIDNADIPDDKKVTIYYGNGEDSLDTAPRGSSHAQIIEMVRATNVADLELGDGSRVQISPEQLIAWNPDVILVNGEPKSNLAGSSAADALMANDKYSELKAVKDKMVLGAPNAPFSWVDRPPGPNRIIGARWLAKKIYPEYLDYDVDTEVKSFFKLFYHVDLTDEQLAALYQ